MTNEDLIKDVDTNLAEMVAEGAAERNDADGTYRLTELGMLRQTVGLLAFLMEQLRGMTVRQRDAIDLAIKTINYEDRINPWMSARGIAELSDDWTLEPSDTLPPPPPRPDNIAGPRGSHSGLGQQFDGRRGYL